MNIAIRDHCVHQSLDRAFEIAKNLGFKGVELSLGGRQMREHPIWTRAGLRQIVDHLRTTPVDLPSVNVRQFQTHGLAHEDPRVREQGLKLFSALAPRASTLTIPAITIPFRRSQSLDTQESRDRAAEALRECLAIAEAQECAVVLGLSIPPEEILAFVETLDSHLIMLDYDILDAVRDDRDPDEDLRTLGELIYQIRMRDVGDDGSVCPIGMGAVDFEPIVAALDEIEYDGWHVIDVPAGPDAVASPAANLATIQELFLWT